VEDPVVVLHPEAGQVVIEVVQVGRADAEFGDLRLPVDPGSRAVIGDRGGAHEAAVADKGVRLFPWLQGVHLELDPGVGHRFDVLDEVPGQPQAERLGLVDGVTGLLRERRDLDRRPAANHGLG
jgi:hypothetical protein